MIWRRANYFSFSPYVRMICVAENGETINARRPILVEAMNSQQQFYEALIARDQRFDGVFFVGVKTTGVYCRPICRSRRPQMRHCEFFRLAAAAEVAGYRPCLRCRPELAPGNAPIDAEERIVGAALRYLDRLEEAGKTVPELASALRFSERHFRRVLTKQLGVSPIQLMQTRRLLLAKQLLTDTALGINDVALASGFKSLRRFNSLFKERYRLSPTGLRNGSRRVEVQGSEGTFRLSYRSPFSWETLLRYFRRRFYRGAESVGESQYWRTARIGKLSGWVVVENDPHTDSLKVKVAPELLPGLLPLISRLRRLFDLDASPDRIVAILGPLAAENPGVRVPGAFDGFEIAMRAVLGQQISVPAATTIAGRITERFGEKIETPFPGLKFMVPTPGQIAAVPVSELRTVGITEARATTLGSLAKAVAGGQVNFLNAVSWEESVKQLTRVPGIGPWTAGYIAMRVLGWPDAFPHQDLGLRKALAVKRASDALALSEKWRPWRAYAAMQLWNSLEKQHEISENLR
ncbi:MAG TPA: AlkA N-terminal domain-containing protein [Chthoniobacterales bacterium]|nr:AlkA N-terminal domain-containing protein [Chthoniobacterales bacterium]